MITLTEDTKSAIRNILKSRNSRYADLDIPATLDYFKRRFVDQIPIRDLSSQHVLTDVGAGYGWLATSLALFTPARVIAVEYDADRLRSASEIGRLLGLEGRIDWRVGSAQDTSVGDQESDVTFCVEVLEHVGGDTAAFAELSRITRQNLVITTPNGFFPVIAHDTRLPGCHWLPIPLRDVYARAFGRARMQHGNRFWKPGDITRHLGEFRRRSRFLHFAAVEDYFKLYPFYSPYGKGRWRRSPSSAERLYMTAVSRLGAATPYLLPSLSGTFERVAQHAAPAASRRDQADRDQGQDQSQRRAEPALGDPHDERAAE